MFEQLLQEAAKPESAGVELPSQLISPQPGFCMKTVKVPEGSNPWANSSGWPPGAEKVFLNICFSEKLPDPPDVSEEKLVELIQVTGMRFFVFCFYACFGLLQLQQQQKQ